MKTLKHIVPAVTLVMAFFFGACSQTTEKSQTNTKTKMSNDTTSTQQITFGAGCFWCVEAVFQNLDGVLKVESGYSGGTVKNPTYREVCTGTTGHAEVCQVTYDPKKISFEVLLQVFWKT